jgi:Fe-S-cluster-containing hydrogenase component 2
VASKCDLCIEAEEPACVVHCPNEAIQLVEVEEKT